MTIEKLHDTELVIFGWEKQRISCCEEVRSPETVLHASWFCIVGWADIAAVQHRQQWGDEVIF